MNNKLNDRVCCECEKPGQLLQCSGGCLRSFHKECLGLSSVPSGRWRCSDCTKREHRCFHCKNYAPDHKLIQCSVPNCRRYYHWDPACCGQESIQHISAFICPSHICANCGIRDTTDNPLVKCIRCTKSYHFACVPHDVRRIDGRYFSCASHRNENPKMPSQSTYITHKSEPVPRQNSPYAYQPKPSQSPMVPSHAPKSNQSPMVPSHVSKPNHSPMAPSHAPPKPNQSPMAPSHAPPKPYPNYYPPMNLPYTQSFPPANPYGYYYPQQDFPQQPGKREAPAQQKPVVKKIKRNLTDEQRAGKTLLSRWKDLRRAGIEIKEEKIKQRGILLANVKEKALAQEKNTLKLRETMGLYN